MSLTIHIQYSMLCNAPENLLKLSTGKRVIHMDCCDLQNDLPCPALA